MASSKTSRPNGFDLRAELARHAPDRNDLARNPQALEIIRQSLEIWLEGANVNWQSIRNVLVERGVVAEGLTGQTLSRFVLRRWPDLHRKIRAQGA